ncbi:MAG: DNA/RNA non-specific endonuclease [Planctomycetes bacterium]|nr:DNA/RNA non-specific endonuclease [Planctomycetota bacterium]
MTTLHWIAQSAQQRIDFCRDQLRHTLDAVRRGSPLDAETDAERLRDRLAVVASELGSRRIGMRVRTGGAEAGAERIWGDTIDFVGVAFLERGAAAARAVGRIVYRDGRPSGTGFLVGEGLLLTNNHVIGSPEEAEAMLFELDHELDASGLARQATRFELAPRELFLTDDTNDLDYSLVALGARLSGSGELASYGRCALSAARDKHALGEVANLVQHPAGRLKEVVLRENRLVSRLQHVLHYAADTQPGSSGSPVFNNQWEVIALHHWGGPWRQVADDDGKKVPTFVNEGIRISAIVSELEARRAELDGAQRARLEALLTKREIRPASPTSAPRQDAAASSAAMSLQPDGTAVWRFPLEIAVRIAAPSSPAAPLAPQANAADRTRASAAPAARVPAEVAERRIDPDYARRSGYDPSFLAGDPLPLPRLSEDLRRRAARNRKPTGADDCEFRYQHFSVFVDKRRGLPLLTACNIDGKTAKEIDRKTGRVRDAERRDAREREEGPEAREQWTVDPRIDPKDCADDRLYTGQTVSDGPGRLNRIFHRGHMVRRLDPCWGSKAAALRAEADTFHFTNCTPQIGAFNSGQTLWLGIENHILDNARLQDQRVCVFTGPVFASDDPAYRDEVFRGFRVPQRFWKLVVWEDAGTLAALALVADQSPLLRELPEGGERLDEVEPVEEFLSVVPEIERLTGLDFGSAVRDADLCELLEGAEGAEGDTRLRRIRSFADVPLRRGEKLASANGRKRAKR